MTRSEITKNTTNEQLELLFKQELASGIPFCFHAHLATHADGTLKKDKNGKEYYSIFIVQKQENKNASESLDAMLLGWSSSRVYRAVKRITKEIFEDKNNKASKLAQIGRLHTNSMTNEQVFAIMDSKILSPEQKEEQLLAERFTTIQTVVTLGKPYEGREHRKSYNKEEDKWYVLTDENGNLTYEDNSLVLSGKEKNVTIVTKAISEEEYQMEGVETI